MGLALHNPSDPIGFRALIEDGLLPTQRVTEESPASSLFLDTECSASHTAPWLGSGQDRHRTRAGYSPLPGSRKAARLRQRWDAEADEGRDLARSSVRLPSDSHRGRRPPSLERQEAFRDVRTSKKRASQPVDVTDDDVANLYRLGLLYDNEHERGSGFTLDAIAHREPLYSLNVRPTKRGRRGPTAIVGNSALDYRSGLPLDLSFAALGDDEALARFLISPEDGELAREAAVAVGAPAFSTRVICRPSMTAIYELEPDGSTSFSLHDSTPRALDICTGTRTPTRSLTGSDPEADKPPDLISDISQDNDNDDKEDDFEWEVVRTLNTLSRHTDATTKLCGADTTSTAAEDTSPSTNPDAWVVLGVDGS